MKETVGIITENIMMITVIMVIVADGDVASRDGQPFNGWLDCSGERQVAARNVGRLGGQQIEPGLLVPRLEA